MSKWGSTGAGRNMQRPVTFAILTTASLLAGGVRAHVEDGAVECADGIDNDSDGLLDCDEAECLSANTGCGQVLPTPLLVDDAAPPYLVFDVAMQTDEPLPAASRDLVVADLNGSAVGSDDLVTAATGAMRLFASVRTDGYTSIPSLSQVVPNFLPGESRIASGDFNGDTIADLVAVNFIQLRRYVGNGGGGFTPLGVTPISDTPGNSIVATIGSAAVAANTRLRVYDSRCTGAAGRCVSLDLAGTAPATSLVTATHLGRHFALTLAGNQMELWELTFGTSAVSAVRRQLLTFTASDIAWSRDDGLFIFSNAAAGTVEARRLVVGPNTAALQLAPGLGPVVVRPAATVEILGPITVGEFKPGERSVVVTEEKTENIYVLPFSTATGWKRTDLVVANLNANDDNPDERARDVVVGQFNDDDLLDIAVLDRDTGNIILVRQQPQPCLAFIVSPSHGLLSTERSYIEIARYNRQLAREIVKANGERRPNTGFRDTQTTTNAAQCPARFVDVRGNWETFSAQATDLAVAGRGLWLTSEYLVFVPISYMPTILPTPALDPIQYWGSAIYLFVYPYDKMARLRFFLGALGGGVEIMGRCTAGAAGTEAAQLVNDRIRAGVAAVDDELPACDGVIYVDLIGHSRGGSVAANALQGGFGPRSNFNFDASVTLLDAIDPSEPYGMPPWIRAGHIVGDRKIRRVGNENISTFFGADSSGEILWPLEQFTSAIPLVNQSTEWVRANVIGLPVGRDRSALDDSANTFGAHAGPILGIRHKEFAGDPTMETAPSDPPSPSDPTPNGIGFMWVSNDDGTGNNSIAVDRVGVPVFTTLTSTHIGAFLANPRDFDEKTAVGLNADPNFSNEDEESCFPLERACGNTTVDCPGAVDDTSARQALSVDSEDHVVRELVPDFDFRVTAGVVANATDIIIEEPDLKAAIPDPAATDAIDFIEDVAAQQWVPGGVWRKTGTVSVTLDDNGLNLNPYFAMPGVNYASMTPTQLEAARTALEDEIKYASASDAQDRTLTLSTAAARLASGDEAAMVLSTGTIETDLFPASLAADELWVRIEFEVHSNNGKLSVDLSGPNLHESITWSGATGRVVGEFQASRSAFETVGRDVINLYGINVTVYAVSVRPFAPVAPSSSTSLFEYVRLDTGVTPERATSLAKRSMWDGRVGRLARLQSTTLQNQLATLVQADARGFVDAASEDGAAGTFKNSAGTVVSTSLFLAGTSFSEPRPRGAQAFAWPAADNNRLGHAHIGAFVGGERAGFWVEYPPQSAMAAAAPSLLDAIAAFFGAEPGTEGEGESVDVDVVAAAPAAQCRAHDGSCFDAATAP
jgi:hypothetical protein